MENQTIDRRKHTRYKVKENVFLYDKKNISEILDISEGGLTIRVPYNPEQLEITKKFNALLLDYSTKCCIENIPCEIIKCHTVPIPNLISPTAVHTCNLKFTSLTKSQAAQIEVFIKNSRKSSTQYTSLYPR